MKFTKPIILISVFASIMLSGCAQKTATPEIQEWAFQPEKVWEFSKAGNDELQRPAEPRVADDGTLFFHDFEKHLSYIVGSDGNLLGTFASVGQDEGDIPMYLNCFPAGDQVVICSMDQLHFFTEDGKFVKAVPNNPFVRFPLAFKNENEFWVAPGALGDAHGDSVSVTRINLTSGEEIVVCKLARSDIEKVPTGGAVVVGLTPQLKMGYDRKTDVIYFGKNSDTAIYSCPASGGEINSFSFNGIHHPVSEIDKRNHFAKFNIPEDALARMISVLPDQMTYYNRIQVIDGFIYLFSSDGIGQTITGQIVDIYSPDGRHLYNGRIQVEDGWHISGPDNLQITDGFVYAVQENGAGDKKIVKYKVTLPQS